MKQLTFLLLAAVIAAASVAMYLKQDIGSLSITFAGHTLETTLLEAGIVAIAVLFAYILLAYTWGLLLKFAALFGRKRQHRLAEKARNALVQGLIELAEGRFDKAERLLLQKVDHSEDALVAYLSAARAAQHQGAHDRRDDYLRRAHEGNPEADIAIGLTQAELQLAHSQFEQALATLTRLNKLSPQHAYVLKLLAESHYRVGDWDRLIELLPDVEQAGSLDTDRLEVMKTDAWCGRISELARHHDVEALVVAWDTIPRPLQTSVDIVTHYAARLTAVGAYGEAEKRLRGHLQSRWDRPVLEAYAALDVLAGEEQVRAAEKWLEEYPKDALLLLALGRMCMSRDLWGKARSYLEASLAVEPMPETFLVLAQLLEDHLDEREQAVDYYRQGLHMLTGDYGEAALARAENDFQRVINPRPELQMLH